MIDLLVKYSKEVDFHVLPVKRLQEFFDFQEHYALIQLFDEFRETRDGRFDPRQLLPLQKEKQIRQKQKDRIQENISSDLAGTAACAMIGGSSIPRISSCDSISSSQGAFTFTTTTNEEEVSDISTHSLSPTDRTAARCIIESILFLIIIFFNFFLFNMLVLKNLAFFKINFLNPVDKSSTI